MPANLTPQYHKAENAYRRAQGAEERIDCLEEMLSIIPKHKGTDKLQADLRKRLKEPRADSVSEKQASKKSHSYKFPRQGAGQVVLVGGPNSGKSRIVAELTKASPEVADYPFTSLEPYLGIAMLPGQKQLAIADIPGLIEGAHRGQGLGTRFLRHIERTSVLVHVLEVDPTDGSDPVDNYHLVRNELAEYSDDLAAKPQIIVLSKMDVLVTEQDQTAAVQRIEQALGKRVMPISAVTGMGLEALLKTCSMHLPEHGRPVAKWSVH